MAAGVELAEAYVLLKLHKEKMKETKKGRTKTGTTGAKANRPSGCFSWFPKSLRRPTRIRDDNEKELIQQTQKMAAGVELAEAHVLRKEHKEKKRETKKGRTKRGTIGVKANRSSGCFSWFSERLKRPTWIREGNEK
ncbi:hypothetical protein E2542_SST20670 [Spatholobus suberectus]|nr:hypothetical protein E2542_SST20670 [Spatholobus suberectus]